MQAHRWQPTRLPCPWDSPGKNIGVGCHFLLQCMKVQSESEVTQLCPTLQDPMDCSLPSSSVHGIIQARVLEWGAIAFCGINVWGSNYSTLSLLSITKKSYSSDNLKKKFFLIFQSNQPLCKVWNFLPVSNSSHMPDKYEGSISNLWFSWCSVGDGPTACLCPRLEKEIDIWEF